MNLPQTVAYWNLEDPAILISQIDICLIKCT